MALTLYSFLGSFCLFPSLVRTWTRVLSYPSLIFRRRLYNTYMQRKFCIGWYLGNEHAECVGESGEKEEGEEEWLENEKKRKG